ncbi:P-loop containing nucleoside triphosphate hydrolase protein [Delitschia confertaspora ATCC 74209]|uniref:P-loop containing nucleoside triphosphate hydrolase protein n=1 Tax=Delitschia confertaspora ATCC 74209 TaxID=1513339 RepID=A0A9P4JI28_9PLEO|nr:P-loop containing nucleoside triphosphate hydrolase protein [Delitschia confertaspora ATCC 74209]
MSSTSLLVGISGPSSSGKTTLARLLRDIFPHTFILHLDDFYLPDSQIPLKNGVQDWDCVEALNLKDLRDALAYIKAHGKAPPDLVSKEDQNAVGEHGVPDDVIQHCKQRVKELVKQMEWDTPLAIVDGFLLFSESMADIRELFDVKLFLRTSYDKVKKRREARQGYVTIDGFWEDPPGYVDQIVWPNYVEDHRFLFQEGDVHGELVGEVCRGIGVLGMPKEAEESMERCLLWAVQRLEDVVRAKSTSASYHS